MLFRLIIRVGSTNIFVGPPINLEIANKLELRLGAPYIAKIRKLWEESVVKAFESMPDIEWGRELEDSKEDIFID